MTDLNEILDGMYERLSLANGIDLDENVARHYRKDMPKLLSAVRGVLALFDNPYVVPFAGEPDEEGVLVADAREALTEALEGDE